MVKKILAIDDDIVILDLIEHSLRTLGYQTATAMNGADGLRLYDEEQPELVILDLMMPHLSGWEVCKRIRARASTPIIMLTAKSDPSDVIKGLRLGADDYVKKPFHPAELHARVEAVLRRYRSSSAATKTGHRLQFDARKLVIDIPERCVTVDGKQISLTSREFDLLVFLARHPGVILTTDKIFGQVWSYDSEADIDNVKWYIWRLRQKIEPNSKDPKTIITERGIGYRFVTE